MKINNSVPSFGCQLRVDVKEEPEQIVNIMCLAMHDKLKVVDAVKPSTAENVLSYQITVPDNLANSLKTYLAQNNMEFEEIN